VSRKKLLLIAGLIVMSTVLYVNGVAAERSQETAEGPGAHQEVSGTPESGKAREGKGVHEEPGSQEHSETGEQ